MSDDAVTIGFIHNGKDVAYSWHRGFVELLGYDMTHGGNVIRGGWAACNFRHNIVDARNKAIADWLDDPTRSHIDWWFWLDTDMGYNPDTVERLLAVADPKKRPIVGGLCFSLSEEADDGMGGKRVEPRPTLFKWVPELGCIGVADYPINTVMPVAATGAACVLIHRSVLEAIRDEHGDTWYDRIPNPYVGGLHSEDISFCLRAGALGFPTLVHTGVRTTHLKHFWVGETEYWNYRPAPPATQPTAVIVPAMERPQNAEPFMTSLRASTGLATCYAICDPGDDETIKAWDTAGATVVLSERGSTFPIKANTGYDNSTEEWMLFVGDDVRFHPGWLDHAQHVGNLQGKDVVATNDLGNTRVALGEHATHPLIRRSYVDEKGASWDGPGVVCHEGYRHWFVDNEWTEVAKQRGVFAAALGSVVEHLHPIWNKGETDAVYVLGQSHARDDERLFKGRLKAYTPVKKPLALP
jgi:hypothetical protein